MSPFTVYPAIDVRDGRVVRLLQGDYGRETRYPDDPLELALRHAAAGARWLHLVDLDAARRGGYTLQPLLTALRTRTGLRIQTGGGVRSPDDVQRLLDAGAQRVVVGSLAVRQPDDVAMWLARFGPGRLTLALDARRDGGGAWRLPVHGWTEDSGRDLFELVGHYARAGLRHLLCTDIDRDGALSGPNLGLYRELAGRFPALAVQASGGARDAADVVAARAAGCGGIILGKALLEGRLALGDALAACAPGADRGAAEPCPGSPFEAGDRARDGASAC